MVTPTTAEGATPATASPPGRSVRSLLTVAALAYVAVAAVLTGIVQLAANLPGAEVKRMTPGADVLGGWCRFDCNWYVNIAEKGYYYTPGKQSPIAFFPGYPMLVRAVDSVLDTPVLSAVLVTWVAGLVAVVLFALWSVGRLSPQVASWSVVALFIYPYGWFLFGAGYGDALFVALVLGAFLLVERDHMVLAGLVGALAGVTRPIGVGIVAGLLLVALERRGGLPRRESTSGVLARLGVPARVSLRAFRWRDACLLLALLGPIAWSAFLAERFGDAFAYVTVQEAWDQKEGPHTWFKIGFGGQLLRGEDLGYTLGLTIQALLTIAALLAIPLIARRLSAAYAGYTAIVVVLAALGTKDFQGMGRYMLAAFPLFALVGILLAERPRIRGLVVVAGGLLLAIGAFGFGRGWYLT